MGATNVVRLKLLLKMACYAAFELADKTSESLPRGR
jgi:hypothetical protein